jgi:hypothetical protein
VEESIVAIGYIPTAAATKEENGQIHWNYDDQEEEGEG